MSYLFVFALTFVSGFACCVFGGLILILITEGVVLILIVFDLFELDDVLFWVLFYVAVFVRYRHVVS